MKIDNVLNYLSTASPEQIDTIRKAVGEKKQAALIKREYESGMHELKEKQANEIKQAELALQAMKDRHIKEADDKLKHYQVSAASRGLHWDEVMTQPKKPRVGTPRKWKVVTPLAVDTRSFGYLKNAQAYRRKMGGYLHNTETGKDYFKSSPAPLRLPV